MCIESPVLFSSRRRHTRSDRDWSSDVCSSDLSERVALRVADGEEVIDVPCLSTLHREPERQVGEELAIPGREPSSALRPLLEPLELHAEDGRLELVEPARVAELLVAVAATLALVAAAPPAPRRLGAGR